MKLPKQVSYIIKTLEKAGFEAYAVGGCVRDYLLEKTPKDWDITTSAVPSEIKKLFPHTYDTGIQHGTITVVIDKENYEITTYRIDGNYSDFRHPLDVTFTKKIDEDLSRRDFTINAIAYNEEKGFCDPYNGRDDLKKKIIKGVGAPDKRFNEDALRMLRCIRFSAQLNFKIEKNTYDSVVQNSGLIKNISIERIRDEFTKIITSPNPEKIIELKNTGLLKEFMPVINEKIYDGCKETNILKNLVKNNIQDISLFYCTLFADLTEKETINIMKTLKFDTKTVKETSSLVKYLCLPDEKTKYDIRKNLSKTNEIFYEKLLKMKKSFFYDDSNKLLYLKQSENMFNEIISDKDCYSLKNLKINGNILKNIGIKNGKNIGIILNACLDEVLKDPSLNEEEYLKKFSSSIIQN